MARRGELVITRLLRLHGTSLGKSTSCYGRQLIPPTCPSAQVRHYSSSSRGGASSKLYSSRREERDDEEDEEDYRPNKTSNKTKTQVGNKHYDRPFKHIVVPGAITPRRPVPDHIERPPYANTEDGRVKSHAFEGPFEIKGPKSIQGMRESCALARKILDFAGTLVKPGVTTDEIDAKVHDAIIASGAYPSTLNYNGFPKSICTSVNEVAAHGIPDDRPLVEGDIISIDVTVFYKGFHGDTCDTFFVGEMIDEKAKRLVLAARKCLDVGIAILRPGIPVAAIGAAIQNEAMRHKVASVQHLAGHGIGRLFHQRPYIMHCKNDYRGILEPGMTFTIEPVIVEKNVDVVTWDDDWTMATKDGGWAAQFEHTVLITETGAEILTK